MNCMHSSFVVYEHFELGKLTKIDISTEKISANSCPM